MQRIGRIGKLKPGASQEYIRLHREFPSHLRETLNQSGIKNFSIYIHGDELFSYLEVEDWDAALSQLEADPPTKEWSELMRTLLDEPLPWLVLEEVFHVD